MALSRKSVKTWYWIHKWSSLTCMAFLLLLCITGLPLIFHAEIDELTRPPEFATGVAAGSRADITNIVKTAREEKPGWEVMFLFWDDEHPLVNAVLGASMSASESDAYFAPFDSRTGERLSTPPSNEGFMFFLLDLHGSLLMGLPGTLFVGLMGLMFIVSVVSGVVVYAPFMRRLAFGTVRKDRGSRIRWLDIHNITGVVITAWVIVVGLSGVIITLLEPLANVWKDSQLATISKPYQGLPAAKNRVAADVVMQTVFTHVPNADVSFIAWPGSPFSPPHHFTVALRGNTPLTKRLMTLAMVDAETGVLTAIQKTPWYLTAVNLSVPLHFGDYGGLPLKIIWALLDVIAILVLTSGIYLWLVRRNKRLDKLMDSLMMSSYEVNG